MPSTLAVAMVLLMSAAGAAQQRAPRLSGTVFYRERVTLTTEAVLEVTLEDTARTDGPATIISRRSFSNPGQVPIAFDLPYDPGPIISGRRYAVLRRIL